MAYLSYQGKRLFYTEYGTGPVVLFLHGNTASSRLFEPLMPLYAARFRCILPDFLGKRPLRPGGGVSSRSLAGAGTPGRRPGGCAGLRPGQSRRHQRRCLGRPQRRAGTAGAVSAGGGRQLRRPHAERPVCGQAARRARPRQGRPPGPAILRLVSGRGPGSRGRPRHLRPAAVRPGKAAAVRPAPLGAVPARAASGQPGGQDVPGGFATGI